MADESNDGALFYGDAFQPKSDAPAAEPAGKEFFGRLTPSAPKPEQDTAKDDGEAFYPAMRKPEGADADAAAKAHDPLLAAESDDIGTPATYRLAIRDSEGNAVDLDPALVEGAAPVFKKLGLSNVQANELAAHYANEVLPKAIEQHQEGMVAQLTEQSRAWVAEAQAHPELKGDGIAVAKSVVDRFGDPELKEFLRESAMGNHPGLIRLLAKVGRALER